MAKRATPAAFDALHAKVAEVLLAVLDGVPVLNEEGAIVGRMPASPQYLAQAIKFLKDNGIESPDPAELAELRDRALQGLSDLTLDDLPTFN